MKNDRMIIASRRFLRRGIVLPVVLGVLAVVGLVAVLGLAVMRTQNLQTVLRLPQAAGLGDIRGCKYTDEDSAVGQVCSGGNKASAVKLTLFNSDGSKKDDSTTQPFGAYTTPATGSFRNLTSGSTYTFKTDSLPGYSSVEALICSNRHVCLGPGGIAYCKVLPGDNCTSLLTKATVVSGSQASVRIPDKSAGDDNGYINDAKFAEVFWHYTTGNRCWINVPIPTNGNPQGSSNVSTTPTFSWTYDTTFSSDIKGTCAYLWSCQAKNDGCYVGAACGTGPGFTSADVTKFGKTSLSPNTTYFWSIVANSYNAPSQQYACMPGYSFTTGTGSETNCSSGQTACGTTCVNLQTDSSNCGSCGNICGSGKTCQTGVCVTATAAIECGNCEGTTGLACAAGLKCLKASGASGGVCVKTDGSTVCGACTQ